MNEDKDEKKVESAVPPDSEKIAEKKPDDAKTMIESPEKEKTAAECGESKPQPHISKVALGLAIFIFVLVSLRPCFPILPGLEGGGGGFHHHRLVSCVRVGGLS